MPGAKLQGMEENQKPKFLPENETNDYYYCSMGT